MKEEKFSGTPIDLEALADVNSKQAKNAMKSIDARNTSVLKSKYGASGISKNNIPEDLQSGEFVEKIEKILKEIKKYGNVETHSFIPAQLAKDIKDYKDHLTFLAGTGNNGAFYREDGKFIAVPENYIYCEKCGGYKREKQFFRSNEKTATGFLNICRDCLKQMCAEFYEKYKDLERTLLLMCLYTNTIFNIEVAELAIKNLELKEDKPNMIYQYYRVELNLFNNKCMDIDDKTTFEFSNFDGNIFKFIEPHERVAVAFFPNQNEETIELTKRKTSAMVKKFGPGFTTDEYNRMEQLYEELSKFKSKKNTIQTNALIEYVRFKVKLDCAIGKGDLKDIEKWQKMADNAAKNAGIKLDQLTAEDFGEGVDSWTNLVELVEEYDSVIPLMPKVKKMAYDDIDFIIWQVINYGRRLVEMPEIEYEDIWKFIDERFIEEMKRRGYNDKEIKTERKERNAIFKDLGDNYIEPLWLNPNLVSESDEEEEQNEN